MSKYLINNFPCYSGKHCATTALSNIAKYYDINYSEAYVMGISSGLSFMYLDYYPIDASKVVFTRDSMLESNFFNNINIDFKWNYSERVEWENIKYYINNNIPVLLLTDVFYLDFYDTQEKSFASHTLVLIGYDETNNIAYVSDSLKEGVLETRLDLLLNHAISEGKPPFYKGNVWSPVPRFRILKSETELINISLYENATRMLESKTGYYGISAIKRLESEILYFQDIPNWTRICNNVYRSLELIGTGGSGFRNLYGEFIKEISASIKFIDKHNLFARIDYLSLLYKRLSKQFFLAARKAEYQYLLNIYKLLSEIYECESEFWELIKYNTSNKNQIEV